MVFVHIFYQLVVEATPVQVESKQEQHAQHIADTQSKINPSACSFVITHSELGLSEGEGVLVIVECGALVVDIDGEDHEDGYDNADDK